MRPSSVTTSSTSTTPSTLSVPARIEWQALNCPACGEVLDLDRDGTSCTRCRGLLAQRVWAERLLPSLGRPALPPVFQAEPRVMGCPGCHKAMAPVLCHGVAAWSCPACRWLFIEGPRKDELMHPGAPAPAPPPSAASKRPLAQASLVCVATERAREAARGRRIFDVLGVIVLAALIIAVVAIEAGALG